MKRCLPGFLVAFLFVLMSGTVSPVLAQDTVEAKGWARSSFGRIVLNWPSQVGYSAAIEGGELVVRFDRPLRTNLNPLLGTLSQYINRAAVSGDGRVVRFGLAGRFTLKTYALGSSVILDLRRAAGADPAPARANTAPAGLETVNVRVGRNPGFTRIVFDWNRRVDYNADIQPTRISLSFERAATVDLNRLRGLLPGDIENPAVRNEGGRMIFSVAKARDRKVRDFRTGNKVVLDVFDAAPVASGEAEPVKLPDPPKIREVPPRPRQAPVRSDAASPQEPEAPPAEAEAPDQTAAAPAPEPAPPEPAPQPAVPEAAPEPAPQTPATAPAPETEAAEPQPQPTLERSVPTADAPAAKPEEQSPAPKPVTLVFEWPEAVGAAVFRRQDYIWIVFDRRQPLDLAPLRAQAKSLIERIEQLPIAGGTVLRLRTKPGINPRVNQSGTNWQFNFGRWPIEPNIPVPLEVNANEAGAPQLLFSGAESLKIINIPDPAIGDMMRVAALKDTGVGVRVKRRYPEFEVLASAQGVALVPLSDGLQFENARGRGLMVTSEGGLFISAVSPQETKGWKDPLVGERLFKPKTWMRGERYDYIPSRQAALRAVVEVPEAKREEARLDLAKFYFARGLGPEAMGILRVVERAKPRLATEPDFIALRGASQLLNGNAEGAKEDLGNPRLDRYRETALWRGFLNADLGDWKKAADNFRDGDSVLRTYPSPLKTIIGLRRIETALRVFDLGAASVWIDVLKQNERSMRRDHLASLLYYRGLLARANRDLDGAQKFWDRAKRSGDPYNGARAELALVNLGFKQESLTPAQAIDRLERLRYQWRGDELELSILEQLGEHYLTKGEYSKGLSRLRVAVTYFPKNKRIDDIAKKMSDTFKKLYLEGGADQMQPLSALALYDEFRELTPAGPDGDEMINRLADRLVNVDLLDRAADLLNHQVRFRLKGEERAVVGTRLALIHLLNRRPKDALEALRTTFRPGLPQEAQDDRRRIRAKAMFELGRNKEAIALLAGDVSIAADQLRGDIYWREQNYREASKVLQRLAGEPKKEGSYDLTGAQKVLNWAVAMRLDKDEQGLRLARELYGPAMKGSPLGDAFEFIASPKNKVSGNLESISNRITEIDQFEAFLNNYRERLLKPQGSGRG